MAAQPQVAPGADADDDALVDDAFALAFEALSEGRHPSLEELLPGREHLRDRIAAALQLAEESVLQRPPTLPQIAGYTVLAVLGRGSMGTVYRARQHSLGREVALKILHPSLLPLPGTRQRFLCEARTLARLSHPHVVSVFDVVDGEHLCGYAMELLPARSLAEALAAARGGRRRLDVGWVVRVGVQVAHALAALHALSVLHRDVKPANILVRADGHAWLSDFGLVQVADAPRQTATGEFLGTAAYAAPEQLRGEPDLDARADVYALGASLFEALTGERPVAGASTAALLRNLEQGRVHTARRLVRDLPRDLETILHKALEPDRTQRYATAAELAADLERLLALRPIHARRAGMVERARKLVRRNRRAVMAATLGAVLMAFLAVVLVGEIVRTLRLPEQRAAALRDARLSLLTPDWTAFAWRWHHAGARGAMGGMAPTARLQETRKRYAALHALGAPERPDHDADGERSAVSLALQLLAGAAPDREPALDHAPAIQEFAGRVRAIRAGRAVQPDGEPPRSVPATEAERRTLGILALLCTDFDLAVACFEALPPRAEGDPVVDVLLGQLYLVAGDWPRAYARLSHAAHLFPGTGFVLVATAEAAARCGDLALARALLARAREAQDLDQDGTLERVAADLSLRCGDRQGARTMLAQLVARPGGGNPAAVLQLGALLIEDGEPEAALAILDRLGPGWPAVAAITSLRRAAFRSWWSTLPGPRRVVVFLESVLARDSRHRLAQWHAAETTPPQQQSGGFLPLLEAAARVRRVIQAARVRLEDTMNRSPNWPLLLAICPLGWLPATLALLPAPASAQFTWVQRHPAQTPGATGRWDHAMAYDVARQRTVLFGGITTSIGNPSPSNDTWEWDGTTWTQVNTLHRPSGRDAHRLAYDSQRQRVVLFGGSVNNTYFNNDTWEYDGNDWVQRVPATSPSPRSGGAFTYDSVRGRILLFGGTNGNYNTLGDTWEYDGTNWTLRSPAQSPSPRFWTGPAMTTDTTHGTVLLYGGVLQSNQTVGETWEWNGTTWTQRLPATSPGPLHRCFPLHDALRGRTLLYDSAAMWEWDGTDWCRTVPLAMPPAWGYAHLVFDSTRRVIVKYGGLINPAAVDETWEYVFTPAAATFATYGAGCPGLPGIPTLTTDAGSLPYLCEDFTVRIDNMRNGPLFFGIVLLGLSNTSWLGVPLPLDLAGAGLPGCMLRCDPFLLFPVGNLGGFARFTLHIPGEAQLVGGALYFQGLAYDPSANVTGIAATEGGRAVVGVR